MFALLLFCYSRGYGYMKALGKTQRVQTSAKYKKTVTSIIVTMLKDKCATTLLLFTQRFKRAI
jgi:hypothetical protein